MAPVSAKSNPAALRAHANNGPNQPQKNTGRNTMGPKTLDFQASWVAEMENYKKKLEMDKPKQLPRKHKRIAKVATKNIEDSVIPSQVAAENSMIESKTPKQLQSKSQKAPCVRRQTGGEPHPPPQLPSEPKRCAESKASCPRAQEQCRTCAKRDAPPYARKIIVKRFHASNYLSTRQIEEKTRILTENGMTLAKATAYLTSLRAVHFLPRDHKSKPTQSAPPKNSVTRSSNPPQVHIEKKESVPIVETPCAAPDNPAAPEKPAPPDKLPTPDKLPDYADIEPAEAQYVGYPFYIDDDEDETHQSNDVRCSPSETVRHKYFTPPCVLSPSLFPNLPPYLSFASHSKKGPPIPSALQKVLIWRLSPLLPRIVRRVVRNTGFNVVENAAEYIGIWEQNMKPVDFETIQSTQKYNHLPGSQRIGRKDNMWRSIRYMKKKYGSEEFGFMQTTYIMPNDVHELRKVWRKHAARGTKWIVKPPAGSRGEGIRVVSKWGQFSKKQTLIVQKYIERPLLINDSKFDLRLYVLVTCIDPLKIYLYKEGLARFACKKYSRNADNLDDRCMHLTNYSINKFSESYSKNMDINTCEGHKWTLKSLWRCLEKRGVNTKRLWATLRNLVIKSIICGESSMNRMYCPYVSCRYNCYELFGFDVLLDKNLVPWLLEVNMSPSLHCDLPLDRHVKGPLIQALLNTALYQVPQGMDDWMQEDIIRALNLQCTNLCAEKRLLTTCLTEEEAKKQKIYTNSDMELREKYLDSIIDDLQPDDVRCLLLAEDELNRSKPMERIFPTTLTHEYHKFMGSPRYYNRLLDAWENRYGNRRADGITLLKELCEEDYHLL